MRKFIEVLARLFISYQLMNATHLLFLMMTSCADVATAAGVVGEHSRGRDNTPYDAPKFQAEGHYGDAFLLRKWRL